MEKHVIMHKFNFVNWYYLNKNIGKNDKSNSTQYRSGISKNIF